ncbi:MAG: hypothetical protein PVS3B2_01400 [Candidatus Dormibacteraceae bacterium]
MTRPKLQPPEGMPARNARRPSGVTPKQVSRLAKVQLELPDGRYLIAYSRESSDA